MNVQAREDYPRRAGTRRSRAEWHAHPRCAVAPRSRLTIVADPAALAATLTERAHPLPADAAVAALREHWALRPAELTRLATERDDTFRVDVVGGRRVLLKVAHPADAAATVDAQLAVLADLAVHAPGLPVSRVAQTVSGEARIVIDSADGPRLARVLSWLDGEPWNARPRTARELRAFGAVQAEFALGVAGAGRRLPTALTPTRTPWNLIELDAMAAAVPAIADEALRRLAGHVIDAARTETHPMLAALPRVLAHNDAHGENVLVAPPTEGTELQVTGLLDFGDLTLTPRVADLAVSASYASTVADTRDPELTSDPWAPAAALIRGATERWASLDDPLSAKERALLAPLILLRLAQRAALNSAVAAANAERAAYASRNLARLRVDLETLVAHPAPDDLGAAP